MKTVQDVLKHKTATSVWSVSPDSSVFDAIKMMADKEVGALLVVDGDAPVGIISERDYTRKVILRDKSSRQTAVSEIMTARLISVTRSDPIDDCVNLMKSRHIRHLPVIDSGRVCGILSLRDLFTETIEEQAATIEQMSQYVRGEL